MKQVFILIIFCLSANYTVAQTNHFPIKKYEIKPLEIKPLFPITTFHSSILQTTSVMNLDNSLNVSAYNYEDLAIFCKLEVQMEKAAGIPVKFRLGEVNYVEKMEGKPYSIFY